MTCPQGTLPQFIEGGPPTIRRTRLPDRAAEVRRIINAGDLEVGDRLVWEHKARWRSPHRHVAFVLANGCLEANGSPHASPTAAVHAVCTSQANGWTAWVRERDGESLEVKRRRIGDDRR
jgi:Restriction Enzyme Adenine Methylase Associated